MTSEEFIKNHSAFWQQNGFDYQFALFIKYLFDCDLDDIVKYEDEDDVVIEYASGGVDLVQVKHSFLEGKRMTNSDENIWKTISNWQHYLTIREQENKPTRDIRCILVVNMTPAHEFLTVIDRVRHGEADYRQLKQTTNDLATLAQEIMAVADDKHAYLYDVQMKSGESRDAFLTRLTDILSKEVFGTDYVSELSTWLDERKNELGL